MASPSTSLYRASRRQSFAKLRDPCNVPCDHVASEGMSARMDFHGGRDVVFDQPVPGDDIQRRSWSSATMSSGTEDARLAEWAWM